MKQSVAYALFSPSVSLSYFSFAGTISVFVYLVTICQITEAVIFVYVYAYLIYFKFHELISAKRDRAESFAEDDACNGKEGKVHFSPHNYITKISRTEQRM